MEHYAHLWLYFLMVLGIIVLPGLDMAYVLASALSGGRKAGFSAVASIVAGGVCHVAAGGLGIGLLLRTVPGLFNAMLLAGALYLAWIGWSLLRSKHADVPAVHVESGPDTERGPGSALVRGKGAAMAGDDTDGARPAWATFRGAAFTNLLNPKAYLFMLAIFPQFLRLDYGPLWIQAAVLGLITALTQTAIYGGLAVLAGDARGWLAGNARKSTVMARVAGSMLILGAVVTVVEGFGRA